MFINNHNYEEVVRKQREQDITNVLESIGVFDKFEKEKVVSMYYKPIGIIYNSCIEVPGKNFLVVELLGCNMQCGYCCKLDMFKINDISYDEVYMNFIEFLEKYLNSSTYKNVVISGGEPLMQYPFLDNSMSNKNITYLITYIVHHYNKEVKIHTNGANFDTLNHMLSTLDPNKYNPFVPDYIAIDIKCSKETYQTMFTTESNEPPSVLIDNVFKSIVLIQNLKTYFNGPKKKVNYEFITPMIPEVTSIDEIERILPYIKEDSAWRFKKFKKKIKHVDAFFDRAYNLLSHEEYELLETAQRKVKNACFINEKT